MIKESFDDRCMTCLIILRANICPLIRTETKEFDKSLKIPCKAVAAFSTFPQYAEPLCEIHLEACKNAHKKQCVVYKILSMEECRTLFNKTKYWFNCDSF